MLQELASCLSVKNPKVVAPGRRSRDSEDMSSQRIYEMESHTPLLLGA
jgi:hypothetical protein